VVEAVWSEGLASLISCFHLALAMYPWTGCMVSLVLSSSVCQMGVQRGDGDKRDGSRWTRGLRLFLGQWPQHPLCVPKAAMEL
jgi:hypothetical protein